MNPQARERKINRRPHLYQAALSVVRRGGNLATKKDHQLFKFALEASGEIGDLARTIQAELTKAPGKAMRRQEELKEDLKKKK